MLCSCHGGGGPRERRGTGRSHLDLISFRGATKCSQLLLLLTQLSYSSRASIPLATMPRPRKAAPAHPPPDPPAATTAANSGMQLTLAGSQLPLAPPALPVRAKPNKETTKNVPAFLTKLFTSVPLPTPLLPTPSSVERDTDTMDWLTPRSMVSDPGTDDLIRWSEDGDSFFGAARRHLDPCFPSPASLNQADLAHASQCLRPTGWAESCCHTTSSTRTLARLSASSTCTASTRCRTSSRASSSATPRKTPTCVRSFVLFFVALCFVLELTRKRPQSSSPTPTSSAANPTSCA